MKQWLDLGKDKRKTVVIGLGLALVALVGVWMVVAPQEAQPEPSVLVWEKLSPYQLGLEQQLAALLVQVEGVEQVQVQITLENEGDSLVEESASGLSSTERVVSQSLPRVRGVAVVCSPSPDDSCRLRLTQLICSLYDVGASQVCVI